MTEDEAPQPIEGEPAAASQGVEKPGTNSQPPIADKDSDYPAGQWMERLHRIRRFLPRPLYRWIDDRLSARLGAEWRRRNRDDKENEEGIPPADERITWHGVWIAEAFLPATARALVAGLERLDWWESYRDKSIAEFIADGRSGRGGGWANLPLLRRRSKRWPFAIPSLARELPDGVEYVSGHIHFLTPSLTVLVAGFRFDSSVSSALDSVLRRRYRTYYEQRGRGSRVMSPTFQRREAVRDLEQTYVGGSRRWLRDHLRGYFASGDEESTAPATLLLTTQVVVPFNRDSDDQRFWMHDAGVDFEPEQWETSITGLRYVFRWREDDAAVLGGRERDIFSNPEEWRRYGSEPSPWALAYHAESHLSKLMALRTADTVLWDVQRRLGRLRDSLADLATSPTKRQLSSVQRQLGTMGSDVTALTSEMLTWPERRSRVLHDIPDVVAIDPFTNQPVTGEEKPLRSRLLDWYVDHAREVRAFEAATRELLVAAAQIAGALENVKLQGFVRWVAVLALIVAIVALVVSGVGVAHELGWLPSTNPTAP